MTASVANRAVPGAGRRRLLTSRAVVGADGGCGLGLVGRLVTVVRRGPANRARRRVCGAPNVRAHVRQAGEGGHDARRTRLSPSLVRFAVIATCGFAIGGRLLRSRPPRASDRGHPVALRSLLRLCGALVSLENSAGGMRGAYDRARTRQVTTFQGGDIQCPVLIRLSIRVGGTLASGRPHGVLATACDRARGDCERPVASCACLIVP